MSAGQHRSDIDPQTAPKGTFKNNSYEQFGTEL